MGGWVGGWISRWVGRRVDGWGDGQVGVQTDGWVDGWEIGECFGGWMDKEAGWWLSVRRQGRDFNIVSMGYFFCNVIFVRQMIKSCLQNFRVY